MIYWVKCPRCGEDAAHTHHATVHAKLCGACAELARDAVVNSVLASCRRLRVTDDHTAVIVDRVRSAMPSPNDPLPALPALPAAGDRLDELAAVGADAWERFILDLDASPARVSAVSVLRPYRVAVVRSLLDAISRSGGVLWT